MESIKPGDLYLSKSELDEIAQLVAKNRHIEDYQNKSSNSLYKIFKKQSKNKERIDNIREELKNPLYNFSKKESKGIKSTLYNKEKIKISSKNPSKYLDKLDKRILELDKYQDYDDYEYKGITNIKDLFKITIDLLFQSFIQRSEESLQNKMKGSDFEFDGINFLYYDFNKTSIYRGDIYIDSLKWLKDKRSTINPKNKDNKCFQYAAILALNIDKIIRKE